MKIDREIEMMLCMNHQGYSFEFEGRPHFTLESMVRMWDILKEDGELEGSLSD